MNWLRFALLFSGLTLASASDAADWPQWRGPNRDGIAKDQGLLKTWPKEGPKLLWTFDKAGVGYGTPAVVGDKLYLMGADDAENGDKEFVLCIDTRTGVEVWRQELETSDGKYTTNWGGGPRGTPTIDGEHLYLLGARGDLQCRKLSDGSKVWGLNFVKKFGGKIPNWGYSESILIDGDKLLCTPGGEKGAIACLKKDTGEEVWRSADLPEEAQYSSLMIDTVGARQYITVLKSGTVSVRATDGKLLWKSKAGANGVAVIPTAIIHDKYVFATSGYKSGCGLIELSPDGDNSVKAQDVYVLKNEGMVNHHGGVILVDGYIYGYNENGGWCCFDYLKLSEENSKPLWKSDKLEKGAISYADGHFYCYGQKKGTCVLIEATPKEWSEKGRFDIPKETQFKRRSGAIWTHPVIANGKLFLRDHELLFCYEIKAAD